MGMPDGSPLTPDVMPSTPLESTTSGSTASGTFRALRISLSHLRLRMLYIMVREAFEISMACVVPPVSLYTSHESMVPNINLPASAFLRRPLWLSSIHFSLVPEK